MLGGLRWKKCRVNHRGEYSNNPDEVQWERVSTEWSPQKWKKRTQCSQTEFVQLNAENGQGEGVRVMSECLPRVASCDKHGNWCRTSVISHGCIQTKWFLLKLIQNTGYF